MKHIILFTTCLAFAITSFAQNKNETLKIVWPEEYKWKVGSNQENEEQQMLELVPGNESIDKWTIMGTMMSLKGVRNLHVDVAMNIMFNESKQNAIDPVLTIVERNDTAKNAWIIFKVEASKFKNDPTPESQLYYIIQGENSLYPNFVAIKEKTLSKEFVDKWAKVFKSSQLVYQ